MAKTTLRPDNEWYTWIRGFTQLPSDTARATLKQWQQVTDVFFSASQQHVHILTGDLKASGESAVRMVDAGTIEGEVSYGGEGVDYADYEFDRGGSHDAPALAWEQVEELYSAALPGVWDAVVRSWG